MVSKKEYLAFIKEIMSKDANNENLKNITLGKAKNSAIELVLGMFSILFGFIIVIFLSFAGFILVAIGVALCVVNGKMLNSYSKTKDYYESKYKRKIIDYLLGDCEYSYDENGMIDSNVFKESCFCRDFDDYKGEDKITIKISASKGDKFYDLELCDLKVTDTYRDDDGDLKTTTVYDGVFGYIEFPFQFKCVLCLNAFHNFNRQEMENVILEDITFSKKYRVYSDNQIEARYILTPRMMEKLLNLYDKMGYCKFSLVNNRMYIGFGRIDLFETGEFRDGKITSLFEHLYDEVSGILDIVKEIEDNDKVFKI